jgi:Flp pilus assembly protein TadD
MSEPVQQPETAEAYNNLGESKRVKGELDGALADFNRAIELKPDLAAAYNNRALVKKAKGDLDVGSGKQSFDCQHGI